MEDEEEVSALDKVLRLQDGLVSQATGGIFHGGDVDYQRLRREILETADVKEKLPEFVRRYRDLNQFWQFIKYKFPTYAERRRFIWDEFAGLVEYLEVSDRTPGVGPITTTIEQFNAEGVQAAWQKALDRRTADPEGAITAARTLLESTCKHVLDDAAVEYDETADLPKLWASAAEQLKLLPSQHDETAFRSILGNCQSVVNGLGMLRNKVGDAHGGGRRKVKPAVRHAELAVNLAGAMSAFLVATWRDRQTE